MAIMTDPTIKVTSATGIWTAAGAWLSALGIGGVFIALIRAAVPWRKQSMDHQDKFMDDVLARLTKVEGLLETERRSCRIEIARIEARAAAQRSLDRHRFNNAEGSFDALLLLLETADLPVKLLTAIAKVREQRLRQRDSEKQEAAMIHAAEMQAVSIAHAQLDEEAAARPPE
jgi:hypothetical protein